MRRRILFAIAFIAFTVIIYVVITTKALKMLTSGWRAQVGTLSISKHPFLLIAIFSSANNFKKRTVVRNTWLSEYRRNRNIIYRFIVGRSSDPAIRYNATVEYEKFKDIYWTDGYEKYTDLIFKSIAVLKHTFLDVEAEYLLKTDDDSYVDLEGIINFLYMRIRMTSFPKSGDPLYWGKLTADFVPDRRNDSLFYISEKTWPHNMLPEFAQGAGYMIGRQLGAYIAKHIHNMTILGPEDVSTGHFVQRAEQAGIPVDRIFTDKVNFEQVCRNDTLIVHKLNPNQMQCLWDRRRSNDTCCRDQGVA